MESDRGKLFVGGISWETTEEKLRNYFGVFGEVVEAVVMKDRTTGRARGFGFIAFADPSVAEMVVLQKHNIDGRMVEAKKAVPRDEQLDANKNGNGGLGSPALSNIGRTKKIFVGGLASTVTENEFKKYFDQFGTITDVVVMYDLGTQRPRGFGFVTYDSEDSVDRVLQKTFHKLNHKMVEVKLAIPKDISAGPNRNNGFGPDTGVAIRGSPYGGVYAQDFNSTPLLFYGSPIQSRYSQSPTSNGLYQPYGARGNGTVKNSSGSMNESYGLDAYGRGAFYGGMGYGSSTYGTFSSSSDHGCMNNGNFGNLYTNSPGTISWGSEGNNSANVNNLLAYNGELLPSLSGYGGLGTWAFSQIPSCNYGDMEHELTNPSSFMNKGQSSVLETSLGHLGLSRSCSGNDTLLGDICGSSAFNDLAWRATPADKFFANGMGFGGLGIGDYGINRRAEDIRAVDEGYGAVGRPAL